MTADLQKVNAAHLKRNAYLYVRQSTPRQVLENAESTKRQYALQQRAIALGWPTERIVVIDTDLGHSGASAVDREGFQKLVAEVGMGHAGLVMDWKSPVWPVTRAIGIGSWRFVRSLAR
jgi:hypothetical protein